MMYMVYVYGVLCSICFLATTGLRVNAFNFINRHQIRNQRIHKSILHSNSFYTVNGLYNCKYNASPMRQQSVALRGSSDDNSYYKGMDAYQILGVPRNADKKAIKAAYRKAVATWHPDKFPDDEAKKKEGGQRMEQINRAWYCLGDDDRKSRYDQYGEEGVGSSAASEEQIRSNGGPGMGGFGGSVDMGDISDIFETFFGGSGGRVNVNSNGRSAGSRAKRNINSPEPGEDLSMEVNIPFMTAIKGGEHAVRVRRMEACAACTGNGVKPGAKVKTCGTCQGQGAVSAVQRTPFGVFNSVQPCPKCHGEGQEVEEYCGVCKGKGSVSETKEITIKIPAGVEAGATMRVRNGGHAGHKGGPNGDLYIQLNVQKDPVFRREGQEIYTIEEISYIQAILGTTIQAHTIDGMVEVKIPAGTQPEQKLRLKGKGVTRLGSSSSSSQRGDAYITVKVRIPTVLSERERELIAELAGAQQNTSSSTNTTSG